MRKIRNLIFPILIIGFLFLMSLISIFKEPIEISFVENREMAQFVVPTGSNLLEGSFQSATDSAFQDQFFQRDFWIKSYTKIENILKKVVYHFVSNDEMLLVDISNGVFRIGKEGDYLTEYPWLKDTTLDSMIDARIQNYNALQESNPETKFYIYKVTNVRDTSWLDAANQITAAGQHYSEWLQSSLSEKITYKELSYDSWQEYQTLNYKTDHHWNMYGAYRGYGELVEMINQDFPIGETKSPIGNYCVATPFYGSLVTKTNFNLEDSIYDEICDFEYDLKEFSVSVNGENVDEFGNRSGYKAGEVDTTKGVNHYREMFGKDSAEVIYDFGKNTGVNALFISDSYTNAIKPVLSSHFDKAVYIDLRYYADSFDLKETIKEYDIDCVIFVGGLFTIMMDEPYIINRY